MDKYTPGLVGAPPEAPELEEPTAGSFAGRSDPEAARARLLEMVHKPKAREKLESLSRVASYDWERLFPKSEGLGSSADIARRVRMLQSIEPRLDYLLYPGERIEFVTKGTLNSYAEQYFLGIWARLINRTLIVFTNFRVILINADGKGRARVMQWQIPYDRIRSYGGLGAIGFKLRGGRKYKFVSVPRADRKRLKAYVRAQVERVRQEEFRFPAHQDRDPLCPACATPVAPRELRCSQCAEEFINPRTPMLMSLLIPGLGDLYMGHRSIAMIELLGFAMLLVVAAGGVASGGADALPFAIGLVVFANVVDAAVTHHIAKKGAMPKRLAWRSHAGAKGLRPAFNDDQRD